MKAFDNPHHRPADVPPASAVARAFHRSLPGYAPTPLRSLPDLAAELGLGRLSVKDETRRLGLPAFKILGASWAAEQVLRGEPAARTLVTASAGNHGRAVAHVAAARGLACRVYLPARALAVRRQAIVDEGAEVIVVDGGYEEAVHASADDARAADVAEIADVGDSIAAHAVIDGYATLFAEIAEQTPAPVDVLLVPVGVGSLAGAAARFGAASGIRVIGVEPTAAACLTASLATGAPTTIDTPGTIMAGMDCAEVSAAAWPSLLPGIAATVTVDDAEIPAAAETLRRGGIPAGECAAAPLAAAHAIRGEAAHLVLVATEGRTSEGAGG